MNKKITAGLLAALIGCSSALTLSGCSSSEYPVSVANIKIEKEPEGIVILDASAADVISYIGYDIKMVGRSDEVDQKSMSVVPSFGSASDPDVDGIIKSGAEVVFADSSLDKDIREKLESSNISVVNLAVAESSKQLETAYLTAGKILGGTTAGAKKGKDAYDDLISELEALKASSSSTAIPATVCYIYGEHGKLKMMADGSYGDMLMSYTGSVNVAGNVSGSELDSETLKIANPNFIFYDSEATLEQIKNPENGISGLSAVKGGQMLEISAENMSRQGFTALDNVKMMSDFINGAVKSTVEPETTVPAATTVAEKYKLKLTDKLSLKPEDDNGNVKIMQQRLYDLGYVTDKENITGYYGGISEQAVKDFQKKNGLKETGTADNATLQLMFSESALGAKDEAQAAEPSEAAEETTASEQE